MAFNYAGAIAADELSRKQGILTSLRVCEREYQDLADMYQEGCDSFIIAEDAPTWQLELLWSEVYVALE